MSQAILDNRALKSFFLLPVSQADMSLCLLNPTLSTFNPLSPDSAQDQFSPNDIHRLS